MQNEIRFNKDIGLWTLDRGIESCIWKTEYCKNYCYNNKLYKIFTKMFGKDKRNDEFWKSKDFFSFSSGFLHKKKVERFRFCSRGEPIQSIDSLTRLSKFAILNPDTLIQIPTRSWRNKEIRESYNIINQPNIRLVASIDPSNTKEELDIAHEYRTFFFGNDDKHPYGNDNPKIFRCPKTWHKLKGFCAQCQLGCFNKEIKHIWLKQH